MMLRLGNIPALVVSSVDAAREMMKTHDLIFSNKPIFGSDEKILVGKGLAIGPYGEYWRQMRSITVLQLLSNKRVQSFKAVREEEIALLIRKLKEYSSLSLSVDLTEILATLTNDVVCRVAFGRKYGDDGEYNFKEILDQFMLLLGSFDIGNFIPGLGWVNHVNGVNSRVNRVAKWFDNFLDKLIDKHIEDRTRRRCRNGSGEKNMDFVDVLLQIQEDHNIPGFSLERDGIKGTISDIFAAGTDTTSTVLEWAMTELLRHPRVMKKVQNERGKAYWQWQINQDVKIMGYDIPAGTVVLTNAWAIGRDPAIWGEPDPDEFRPERFLNSPIDFKGNEYFQAIPFGAGRRSCPGLSFAMVMSEIVLANLVYMFDWSLPSGATGQDLDMTPSSGLIAHRKVHLKAVASTRPAALY
ncbi:Cytochrome P450 [Corchorus capsularis]|uniref:Cytochrome P450 n=1 Tax=Corchorus capsularis TaxID=210143 RepID=A0A1R3HP92_COCAP|nr:Cytochrome P450 [Corchorus capsularis]